MKVRALVFAAMAAVLAMPSLARAADNAGTIAGSVHNTSGAPIADANVIASGAVTQRTSTDSSGKFALTLPAGFYRIDVSKGGYLAATETDLTLLAGATLPVDITLQQADLASLKTIARVTSSRSQLDQHRSRSNRDCRTSRVRKSCVPADQRRRRTYSRCGHRERLQFAEHELHRGRHAGL